MERNGSRRKTILEAMIRVAGSKGYLAASVADVLVEAGASRTTFYKHFEDKRDCFLGAYDLAAERILRAGADGCARGRSWQERAVAGLSSIVELLGAEPALARVAVIESVAAGTEGRRRRQVTLGRLAQLLEPGRRDLTAPDLPPHTALMAVGAVVGLVFDGLQDDKAVDLPSLLPDLSFALLVPYLGPRATTEACAAAA